MTGSSPRLLAEQVSPPQAMPAVPPAREFLTSAGFAGALAVLAALIVAVVAAVAVRGAVKRHRALVEQQESHQRELRDERRRAARIQECRERLVWVVDKGSIEPAASEGATVGLGPELALTVLQGIQDDAEKLGDATLAKAAAVQLDQFSRVLARQSGALAQFAAPNSVAQETTPGEQAASDAGPEAAPTSTGEQPSAPARQVSTGGRRRRQ